MKKIFLFALMTFFVQTSFCQNLSDTVNVEYSKNSPGRLTIGFGIPMNGIMWAFSPNLNRFLDAKRIETRSFLFSIPINLNYQKNRFKIGGDFIFYLSDAYKSQDKFESTFNVKMASLSLGYAVFAERNYFLYVNVGAGYAEYLQTIEIKNSPPTSLSSALQSGIGQSFVLRNKGTFLDFSLETVIRTKKVNAIGQSIKLGYRYGLKENEWNSTFNSFSETPSDRMGNLYFQFAFTLPYKSWLSSENSKTNKK